MKRLNAIFVSLACLVLASCAKPVSQEQEVVDKFNANKYGFSLVYSNGHYSLSADNTIPVNDLKKALDGSAWRVVENGVVKLDGWNKEPRDGGGSTVITFEGSKAEVSVKPDDPTQEVVSTTESLSYEDNTVVVGSNKMLVYEVVDGVVFYIEDTAYPENWACRKLVQIK